MREQKRCASRHQLRLWLKWAIESGLLEKLPPQHEPEETGDPQPTDRYARALLAELRDPESSTRPIEQLLTEAREFATWVERRQKMCRQIILAQVHPEDRDALTWEGHAPVSVHAGERPEREQSKRRPRRPDPMWDDWLDAGGSS